MSATKGKIVENGHHLILTIVAGVLNFIPVFTSVQSNVEGSFYASSLHSDVFRGGSLVLLTLIVPLGFDLLFDILNGDADSGGNGGKKRSARASPIGDITVNSLETVVFFLGLAIWPISAFLPESTSRLALISLCCRKSATNMVGGAFVSSLARYDDWTRPSLAKFLAFSVIVLLCVGGILSTFAENATANGHLMNSIFYVGEAFGFVGGATIVIMCALWLISIAESSWATLSKSNASKTTPNDAVPKKDDSKGSGGAGAPRSRHPSSLSGRSRR
jgi:hypothetical protein